MASNESFQNDFYNRIASGAQIGGLYDALPYVLYFVKDRESRFVSVNKSHLQWLEGGSGKGVIGMTDADFFEPELVEQFLRSDHKVFNTGRPLTNEPEVNCDQQGHQEWFVTNKHPLFDKSGDVVGLAGITQSREQLPLHAISNERLRKVVTYIRENQDRTLEIDELVRVAVMSSRQLYRKFDDAFQTTPVKFAMLTRLRSARREPAQTTLPVSEIALKFGFYDQSAFPRVFKSEVGMTPLSYREKIWAEK